MSDARSLSAERASACLLSVLLCCVSPSFILPFPFSLVYNKRLRLSINLIQPCCSSRRAHPFFFSLLFHKHIRQRTFPVYAFPFSEGRERQCGRRRNASKACTDGEAEARSRHKRLAQQLIAGADKQQHRHDYRPTNNKR